MKLMSNGESYEKWRSAIEAVKQEKLYRTRKLIVDIAEEELGCEVFQVQAQMKNGYITAVVISENHNAWVLDGESVLNITELDDGESEIMDKEIESEDELLNTTEWRVIPDYDDQEIVAEYI